MKNQKNRKLSQREIKAMKDVFSAALDMTWSDGLPKNKDEVKKMVDKGIDALIMVAKTFGPKGGI